MNDKSNIKEYSEFIESSFCNKKSSDLYALFPSTIGLCGLTIKEATNSFLREDAKQYLFEYYNKWNNNENNNIEIISDRNNWFNVVTKKINDFIKNNQNTKNNEVLKFLKALNLIGNNKSYTDMRNSYKKCNDDYKSGGNFSSVRKAINGLKEKNKDININDIREFSTTYNSIIKDKRYQNETCKLAFCHKFFCFIFDEGFHERLINAYRVEKIPSFSFSDETKNGFERDVNSFNNKILTYYEITSKINYFPDLLRDPARLIVSLLIYSFEIKNKRSAWKINPANSFVFMNQELSLKDSQKRESVIDDIIRENNEDSFEISKRDSSNFNHIINLFYLYYREFKYHYSQLGVPRNLFTKSILYILGVYSNEGNNANELVHDKICKREARILQLIKASNYIDYENGTMIERVYFNHIINLNLAISTHLENNNLKNESISVFLQDLGVLFLSYLLEILYYEGNYESSVDNAFHKSNDEVSIYNWNNNVAIFDYWPYSVLESYKNGNNKISLNEESVFDGVNRIDSQNTANEKIVFNGIDKIGSQNTATGISGFHPEIRSNIINIPSNFRIENNTNEGKHFSRYSGSCLNDNNILSFLEKVKSADEAEQTNQDIIIIGDGATPLLQSSNINFDEYDNLYIEEMFHYKNIFDYIVDSNSNTREILEYLCPSINLKLPKSNENNKISSMRFTKAIIGGTGETDLPKVINVFIHYTNELQSFDLKLTKLSSLDDVLDKFISICKCVNKLHNVFHCAHLDLKPSNIISDYQGVKLIDFQSMIPILNDQTLNSYMKKMDSYFSNNNYYTLSNIMNIMTTSGYACNAGYRYRKYDEAENYQGKNSYLIKCDIVALVATLLSFLSKKPIDKSWYLNQDNTFNDEIKSNLKETIFSNTEIIENKQNNIIKVLETFFSYYKTNYIVNNNNNKINWNNFTEKYEEYYGSVPNMICNEPAAVDELKDTVSCIIGKVKLDKFMSNSKESNEEKDSHAFHTGRNTIYPPKKRLSFKILTIYVTLVMLIGTVGGVGYQHRMVFNGKVDVVKKIVANTANASDTMITPDIVKGEFSKQAENFKTLQKLVFELDSYCENKWYTAFLWASEESNARNIVIQGLDQINCCSKYFCRLDGLSDESIVLADIINGLSSKYLNIDSKVQLITKDEYDNILILNNQISKVLEKNTKVNNQYKIFDGYNSCLVTIYDSVLFSLVRELNLKFYKIKGLLAFHKEVVNIDHDKSEDGVKIYSLDINFDKLDRAFYEYKEFIKVNRKYISDELISYFSFSINNIYSRILSNIKSRSLLKDVNILEFSREEEYIAKLLALNCFRPYTILNDKAKELKLTIAAMREGVSNNKIKHEKLIKEAESIHYEAIEVKDKNTEEALALLDKSQEKTEEALALKGYSSDDRANNLLTTIINEKHQIDNISSNIQNELNNNSDNVIIQTQDSDLELKEFNSFEYYVQLGYDLIKTNKYLLAINSFEKAKKINSDDINVNKALSILYNFVGYNLHERIVLFDLLKLDIPKISKAEVYCQLGLTYDSENEFKKAKDFYTKAYELMPNNSIVAYNYATSLDMNFDYNGAIDILSKFDENLISDRIKASWYNRYANCYWMLGKHQDAIKIYEQGINAGAIGELLYLNYADALISEKKYNKASEFINKAEIITNSDNIRSSALDLKAKIYEFNKNFTKAIDTYKNALDLNSDNIKLYSDYSSLLLQLNNYDEAIKIANIGISKISNNTYYINTQLELYNLIIKALYAKNSTKEEIALYCKKSILLFYNGFSDYDIRKVNLEPIGNASISVDSNNKLDYNPSSKIVSVNYGFAPELHSSNCEDNVLFLIKNNLVLPQNDVINEDDIKFGFLVYMIGISIAKENHFCDEISYIIKINDIPSEIFQADVFDDIFISQIEKYLDYHIIINNKLEEMKKVNKNIEIVYAISQLHETIKFIEQYYSNLELSNNHMNKNIIRVQNLLLNMKKSINKYLAPSAKLE